MRKKALLVILIIIILGGVYLNRSYSYIYSEINQAGLQSPDKAQSYVLDNPNTDNKLKYTVLGDSLTAGVGVEDYSQAYPYLVAEKLEQADTDVTLAVRSEPGMKAGDLKDELVTAAILDQPEIITILIGVNDVQGNISRGEFKNNYSEILRHLTQETKAKIYLINIPYIGASNLILPPYNYYFNWRTSQFNKVIKGLAEDYKVGYIDLYSPTVTQFKKAGAYYSLDSFHPSAAGYSIWAQIIYDHIN